MIRRPDLHVGTVVALVPVKPKTTLPRVTTTEVAQLREQVIALAQDDARRSSTRQIDQIVTRRPIGEREQVEPIDPEPPRQLDQVAKLMACRARSIP